MLMIEKYFLSTYRSIELVRDETYDFLDIDLGRQYGYLSDALKGEMVIYRTLENDKYGIILEKCLDKLGKACESLTPEQRTNPAARDLVNIIKIQSDYLKSIFYYKPVY